MPRAVLSIAWSPTGAVACTAVEDNVVKKGGGTDCDRFFDELSKKYGEPKVIDEGCCEVGIVTYVWGP